MNKLKIGGNVSNCNKCNDFIKGFWLGCFSGIAALAVTVSITLTMLGWL